MELRPNLPPAPSHLGGANKYESSAKGLSYMANAKAEAIAAREALSLLANIRGVTVEASN